MKSNLSEIYVEIEDLENKNMDFLYFEVSIHLHNVVDLIIIASIL